MTPLQSLLGFLFLVLLCGAYQMIRWFQKIARLHGIEREWPAVRQEREDFYARGRTATLRSARATASKNGR